MAYFNCDETGQRDPNDTTNHKGCVIKRTHIYKFVNNFRYRGCGLTVNLSCEVIKMQHTDIFSKFEVTSAKC